MSQFYSIKLCTNISSLPGLKSSSLPGLDRAIHAVLSEGRVSISILYGYPAFAEYDSNFLKKLNNEKVGQRALIQKGYMHE